MDSVAALDEPQESRPLPGGLGLVLGSSGRGLHIIVLSSLCVTVNHVLHPYMSQLVWIPRRLCTVL